IDRAVKGEVDAGLRARVLDLPAHRFAGIDDIALVIRHVDDGGNAAGGRRAGRPDEILLVLLAQRMDLRVDGAGKDQRLAEIVAVAAGRRRPIADGADLLAGDGDIAAVDYPVGQHYGADEHNIEISHGRTCRIRARSLYGTEPFRRKRESPSGGHGARRTS